MIYGSVCSGIEAASVAWKSLGWRAAFLSEIEPFPRAVLAHHYPGTPLHGDFTTIQAGQYEPIDLLVGGTPCQSFSVAGLRGGLADERGNLALEFLRLAERLRPRWLVWENVPGILSSGDGRDFGSFLGGLVQLGYGFSYRVLDAQFFGLAQRRKRVFVVGHLGDWRRAAAVLFEPASLRWNPPPRREERQGTTGTPSARASAGGGLGTDFECGGGVIAPLITLNTGANIGVAHALRADGFDASEDGTGRGTPLVPVAFGWQNSSHQGDSVSEHTSTTLDKSKVAAVLAFDPTQISSPTNRSNPQPGEPCHTLAKGQHAPVVALDLRNALRDPEKQGALNRQGCGIGDDLAHTLSAGVEHGVATGAAVRRLTPEECEALQGFPRGYTDVPHRGKPAADGPRYRALGNSMAVPCMDWIGRRIATQEAEIRSSQQAAA